MPWLRARSRHSQYFRPCASDGLLDEYANFIVLRLGSDDSVSFKYSSRVGIHHKNRMVAGIKQNGIGGFWSNSVQRQQLGAKLLSRLRKHTVQRTAILGIQKLNKCLDLPGFLPEVS